MLGWTHNKRWLIRKPDKLSQGAHSQTGYPRVQQENALDKMGCRTQGEGDMRDKEEEREQRTWGIYGHRTRSIVGCTHAAGN